MSDLVGKTLGKYQIMELLGQGGMAEVYRAFQPGLDRVVAIKVVHSFLSRDENFLGRFRREAQAVADLRHPNIIQVFDFDIQDGRPYMVLEFIDGVTLGNVIDLRISQLQTMDLSEVLWMMEGLCSAVYYAHNQGIVHRDITPANVMLTTDKRVILTDFGLVRILGGIKFTATGQITGTPEYMSPEQAHGSPGDQRSDIYALGILLYECLTGNTPYQGDTPVSILLKHVSHPVPLLREIKPELPQPLDSVLAKALSKDPEERYQSGAELWEAIRTACPQGLEMPEKLWAPAVEGAMEKRKTTIKRMTPVEVPTIQTQPIPPPGTSATNLPMFSLEQVGQLTSQILVGIEAKKEQNLTASGSVRSVSISQSGGATLRLQQPQSSILVRLRTSVFLGALSFMIGAAVIFVLAALFRVWTGETPITFWKSLLTLSGSFAPEKMSILSILPRTLSYILLTILFFSLPALVMGAFFRTVGRAFDLFLNSLGYLFVSALAILCYNSFVAFQAVEVPAAQFAIATTASLRQISSIATLSPATATLESDKLTGEQKQNLVKAQDAKSLNGELIGQAVATTVRMVPMTSTYVGAWTLGYMMVLSISLAVYASRSRIQVWTYSIIFTTVLAFLVLQAQAGMTEKGAPIEFELGIISIQVPEGIKQRVQLTWVCLAIGAFIAGIRVRPDNRRDEQIVSNQGQTMSIHLQS